MNPNYRGETTLPLKVTQTMCFEAPEDVLVMESSVSVQKEYALGEEIARGGMGRIYVGTDPKLEREVAVKVSTAGQSGEDSMFFKEAKVLGVLAHPNIVPIHNLGEDRHGRPFYSMKLVKGRTLQSVLKGLSRRVAPKTKRYSRAALISVFKKVCDAAAFAHSKGYLHRDIKPENVMLGEFGEVLLMDWGLAEEMCGGVAVSEVAASRSGKGEEAAQKGYIQGTPTYMSPEQANGTALDVRSDIYALGGLLFSLLTYRSPVEGKSVNEILSKVRTGEILPMDWLRAVPQQHLLGATRQKEISQSRDGPYRRRFSLRIAVPSALKAVTCKAMALDREERYQSVAEMLEDIEAYQNGFATEAEQAGLLRQIILLVRRHRAAAAFCVLLLVCCAVFTAQLAASEQRARENALLAKKEAQRALLSEQEAKVITQEAHKQAGIARANATRVLEEKEAARVLEAGAQLSLASVAEDQAHGMEMQNALARVPEDLREQPWRYLNQKLNTSTKTFDSRGVSVWRDCVPHPLNKNLLVTLQSNGWIRLLDLSTGAVTDLFRIDPNGLKNCLAVSQDGKRVAVHRQISEPSPPRIGSQNLEVFNLADGQTQCSFMMPEDTELGFRGRLVFSPDGNLLLMSSSQEVGFYMFDAWQGTLLWSGTQKCHAIAGFSNKGNNAMVCTDREGISQRDPWTGKVLRSSPQAKLGGWKNINIANPSWASVFFVRNGYCFNMEAEGGKFVAKFPLPAGASFNGEIAYLPEQNVLGVIAEQSPQFGILQFWNVDTGDLLRSVPVSTGTDSGRTSDSARWAIVAIPKAGQFVVTRGTQMKVWSFPSGHGEKILPIESETKGDSFVFLKRPDFVAGAFRVSGKVGWGVGVGIGNTHAKAMPFSLTHLFGLKKRYGPVVTSDQSGELICTTIYGEGEDANKELLRLFRMNSEVLTEIPLPPTKPLGGHGHLSPNGERIWAGDMILAVDPVKPSWKLDRSGVLDPEFNERMPRWVGNSHVVEIVSLEGSKDAGGLAAERSLLLWNAEDGSRSCFAAAPYARALSASPDGTQIAEGGSDKMLRIRDGRTLAVQRVLRVHDEAVCSVAWHPSLPLVATASSEDRSVRIWDLNKETMLEEFGFFEFADRVFWSIDGSELAVRSRGNASQIEIFRPKACQISRK